MDPVCGTLSCGTCTSPDERCDASGMCECRPDCDSRECGMDPVCGTLSCGSCGESERCDETSGTCECVPACGARECGLDPVCGTLSCGTCISPYERCTEDTGMCEVPSCDGGLLDISSGLCWQEPPEVTIRNWHSAVAYCDTLDLDGHGPGSWHLPTISELRSLIRGCPVTMTGGACRVTDSCSREGCWNASCRGCSFYEGPGTEGGYWPAGVSGPVDVYWWSSSSYGGDLSRAWLVSFNIGYVGAGSKTSMSQVRCVRASP